MQRVGKGGCHYCLDGMQPVFGLIEHNGLAAFKHLVCNLQALQSIGLAYLAANFGLPIMKGRQAVHKYSLRASQLHNLMVYLVGQQLLDALRPDSGGAGPD